MARRPGGGCGSGRGGSQRLPRPAGAGRRLGPAHHGAADLRVRAPLGQPARRRRLRRTPRHPRLRRRGRHRDHRSACTSTYCDRDGSLNLKGYGNLVELDHGAGVTTRYAHLSGYTVTPGRQVPAGALLGHQGATGNSTGVHLHFEVRVHGAAVDPVPWLAERGVDLHATATAG
ncbi:M23 family metallopeptidase [Modestobacter sp. VKM Ac-2979]|uniref:M23 family metallopeptidase n=1 Tax=unclassified Modestobacter TaxID=2643866 RepID=UPI0022ABB195|nr:MULTISPECIES: M23 family metallopeptidase [unclassified Modestobacter]MCZ2812031.1 M23 family metallopeptidase [Modestobacter sp. VKM Ac-2979]MCZ2843755.1 M23 family metallopeptidase [Modestobacter sp. VKM Ac-2980]